MKRILLGGAGGAPTNNVVMSLRDGGSGDHLVGMSSVASDLLLAEVDERHVVPNATDAGYPAALARVIQTRRPDFLHVQHDFEVRAVSRLRGEIAASGVRLYLPDPETVERCVDKGVSAELWRREGVPTPETVLLREPADLSRALERFGGRLWLRATEGGGGRGALPVRQPEELEFARLWVERFGGWGTFTAAELLTDETVTWLSIWFQGDLVVAQTRRRRGWSFGDRTLSGVTGVTRVSETCSDEAVTEVALAAIRAVGDRPHGIFGVDMTYDGDGRPRVTEINIGRFFTTVYFLARAGLNMPQIYRDIALEGRFPTLARRVNPLPDGLVWIRGMDVAPLLTNRAELDALEQRPG